MIPLQFVSQFNCRSSQQQANSNLSPAPFSKNPFVFLDRSRIALLNGRRRSGGRCCDQINSFPAELELWKPIREALEEIIGEPQNVKTHHLD